jgi:hypothetical protein
VKRAIDPCFARESNKVKLEAQQRYDKATAKPWLSFAARLAARRLRLQRTNFSRDLISSRLARKAFCRNDTIA